MKWPWDRKRTASTAAVVTVPAVLATLAVVNPGFPLAQVDLNDGAVWLTATSTLQLGRYNAQVEELNAGLVAKSGDFDVQQEAADVLLVEPGALTLVDPASVAAAAEVAVPAGAQVSMQAGTVAVLDAEGQVWVRTLADLPALQTSTDPADATVDGDARVVVGSSGDAFLVATDTGAVTRLTPRSGGAATTTEESSLDGGVDAVTAVGDTVIGLDGDTLRTQGGSASLGLSSPVLQQPGPQADVVLVAGSSGLVEASIADGSVVAAHDGGGGGTPAAPVRVGDCGHAAWPSVKDNYLLLCDGQSEQLVTLDGMTSGATLKFRVNRSVVALNETTDGRLWLPLEDTELREPDWSQVIPEEETEDENEEAEGDRTTHQLVAECSTNSATPTAVDNDFGVRPGRSAILSVIDNDTSSDCGILAITEYDPLPEAFGTLEPVYGGRAMQVRVNPEASGSVSFTYSISDGRGTSSPSTATVTLTVRDSQDEPPVQDRTGSILIEQQATATYPVLADFSDPDGDELTLVGATAEKGTARFRQDGTLTYVADGGDLGPTTVHLLVSDGTHTTEGTVDVDVRAAGTLDLQLDPVHAETYVDRKVTLLPLEAVRTHGAETPRLAGVDQVSGTTITPDLDQGTIQFSAPRAGTYYVSFTVAAAPQQATGLARIDVVDPPEVPDPPVAVLDRAWLPTGGDVTVAPLANDVDPAGGVLVLQSVGSNDELKVAVRGHELIEISAVGALAEPVLLEYVVSNGSAVATGQILVQPVPPATTSQPPVVPNAVVEVRTGGVVTIPVLEDAYDPDGDTIALSTQFAEPLGEGQGLMFVSGDVLRYQAPDTAMTVRATFVVTDSAGNQTAATATVRVHESDPATKVPPRPKEVVGRVFAGDTVRLAIPLVGIDVDGDGVTLLGVDTAGTKGRVTAVGADWIEYEALPGESGTDDFTYAVEDWTGQRAVGTVRVGIVDRPEDSNRVVARDDEVTVRPGQRVEVRVLDNDVDLAGGDLSLDEDLEVPAELVAEVDGSRIVVDAPGGEGAYTIGYSASNERGARSGAVLTVRVDPNATLLPPVAKDVVVPPADTIDKTSVDVNVLEVAQNPSGPMSDLAVSVPASAQDVATVRADGTVRITLTETAQTLPYQLTNTADETGTATAYAFITVPALGFFPPQLRPKADELRVASGETLTISLGAQVQVAPGRSAQIADATAVTATRSNGAELVVDATTLQFTSEADYVGPASITVPVTDATGPDDLNARTRTLTLPITVFTEDDYPPTFSPSRIEVAPGEAPVMVDLKNFTQGVEGADGDQTYGFRLTSGAPAGFSASLDGSRLSVSAATTTMKGSAGTVQLQLTYGRAGVMDVQVEVRAIASTRRLASVPDRMINDGVQGQEMLVDILSGAYNPFPDQPLTLVGASVQTPGTGTASVSGSSVAIRPDADLTGQMVVQVRVRDATDDASREVAATITLRVRGKPAVPKAPRIGDVSDATVVLSWDAPDARGEPIQGYRVTVSPGGEQRACASTTCTINGLTNNVEYTFTVAAQNAVGWSDPSPASAKARPDAIPDAPGAPSTEWGDGWISASWNVPHTNGSPVSSYTAVISPAPPGGQASKTVTSPQVRWDGLVNGTAYTVQVRAHSAAESPSAFSPSSSPQIPAGKPDAPTVSANRENTPAGGQINVNWTPGATNGAEIVEYQLVISGGSPISLGGGTTSYVFNGARNGTTYTFEVSARNKAGFGAAGRAEAKTYGVPGQVQNLRLTPSTSGPAGSGSVAASWSPVTDTNGSDLRYYEIAIDGGGWQSVGLATSYTVTGRPAGQEVAIKVRAVNEGGSGAESETKRATPQTLPSQPGSITATPLAGGGQTPVTQARITWSAPDSGGSTVTFRLRITAADGEFTSGQTTASSLDMAVPATVGQDGWVQVTVTAVNAVGEAIGTWSGNPFPWTPPDPDPGDGGSDG
ncbi:fibronectin type III domain-containing protein [Cellulomonas sp. NPDC089187]|uniref:Ig-like domain-containing protein n=1 Tax=Cellulomonas sp. NPDC089187 TaxID=3154970 RepID=UPI00343A4346